MSEDFASKRREPRYPARLPLILKLGSTRHEVITDDVSYRGLFVCTDTPPALRQLISLEATLPPTDTAFQSHGMICFVRGVDNPKGEPPGVGIQFYAQGGADKKAWERFIEHVKAGNVVGRPRTENDAAKPAPVRRRHPRYSLRLAVRPRTLKDLEILYTRDISRGGMFLVTGDKLPAEGSPLALEVHHPKSAHVFPLDAVVRRVNKEAPVGIGVEFVEMNDARREEFLLFIRDEIELLKFDDIELIDDGDPALA